MKDCFITTTYPTLKGSQEVSEIPILKMIVLYERELGEPMF